MREDEFFYEMRRPSFSFQKLKRMGKIFGILFLALILFVFVFSAVRMIPAGHVGVQLLFGRVYEDVLGEGLHLINPLKSVVLMSVRTKEVFEKAPVPSREGLTVNLEVSALYHLIPTKAAQVYRTIGVNFQEIVVEPQLRSVIRGVTVNYEAKALYTSGREQIANEIFGELSKLLEERGIMLEKVLLRKIELPKMVEDAINNKLAAEQEAERMKFVLLKEEREAERKRIEAKGIADFQRIVSRGLNEQLLLWKGIEATERLASSNNSKVVVIGSGKTGLPIILGGEK